MISDNPDMLYLGLDDKEQQHYSQNKIIINKRMSIIQTKARQRAKLDYCYYCKKPVTSFCNSHSVPKFCLKRIAIDGKVYYANTLINLPLMGNEKGVNEAGTFQLICRDCDNKIFQEYENPDAYKDRPTSKMLAQIAMKNYMIMISKRLYEKALYDLMGKEKGSQVDFIEYNKKVISLDLTEYNTEIERTKLGVRGQHDNWYYLCYYQHLDYTVPITFQGVITLISDFEDNVINDIYNLNPSFHTKEIHIAVFPLKKSSVIMLFIDSRDKRYRNFYKQLKNLSLEDQLSAINYIVFSYSEEIYFSKEIASEVLQNQNLIMASKKSNRAVSYYPFNSALKSAVAEFSLSKRNEIPNLLSKQFSIG